MHSADGGYAAARPPCMNLPALDEMPATERAETSIISRLASSIFVPDCFLLVRVSRAVVTTDTCCPHALRPANTTYSSALPCCARALVLPLAYFSSAIVSCFFPLASFMLRESDCSHRVRAYAELPHLCRCALCLLAASLDNSAYFATTARWCEVRRIPRPMTCQKSLFASVSPDHLHQLCARRNRYFDRRFLKLERVR